MNTKLTLIYESQIGNDYHNTTTIFAIGFSPETVIGFFDNDQAESCDLAS